MQGLLEHTVIPEVEELEGMYKQAFDRIMNQVVMLNTGLLYQSYCMTTAPYSAHACQSIALLQKANNFACKSITNLQTQSACRPASVSLVLCARGFIPLQVIFWSQSSNQQSQAQPCISIMVPSAEVVLYNYCSCFSYKFVQTATQSFLTLQP